MSKADQQFVTMCRDILDHGTTTEGQKVRPVWEDGTPAYTIKNFGVTARYDLRLPEDGAAVDPDARNFPVFYREELTRDVLAARLWQGDFAGCTGASFGVLEPDGTLLEISVYAQDPLALLEFLLDG